jgi:hypothetical protein
MSKGDDAMRCENPNCHCLGDLDLLNRGACVACSKGCASSRGGFEGACACGHLSCQLLGVFVFSGPASQQFATA